MIHLPARRTGTAPHCGEQGARDDGRTRWIDRR